MFLLLVRRRVLLEGRSTMTTLAEAFAERGGDDRPGCTFEGRTTPWNRIVTESATRAEILQNFLDPTRQRRFAILAEDSCEYMYWMGAALASNACMTGLDSTRSADVNASVLKSTHAQFVVTDDAGLDVLDTLDIPPFQVLDLQSTHHLAILDDAEIEQTQTAQQDGLLCSLIIESPTFGLTAFDVTDTLVAYAANEVIRATEMTSHDTCYDTLPLSCANSVLACWGPAMMTGAEIVFQRSFSALSFLDDIREFNCTYFVFAGSMIDELLALPSSSSDTDHRLRVGFGTESTPDQRRRFHERFGCELVAGDKWRPANM